MHLFIRKAGFAFPMKHIPIPPDPFPHFRLGNMANSATAGLVHAKRAFEGAIGLLPSKARNPFSPDGSNAVLNVEMFGGDDDSDWPYLLFVHGICESAETWTVQRLAIACKENKCRLAVLELEGHGLSTGKRSVCGSFERLCHSVNSFIQHIISGKDSGISFVICGSSLGGILAAYGADFVMKKRKEPGSPFQKFLGAIPIVPAVGIAPEAVPSAPIVRALSIFAAIAPSTGILTPKEDPSHYACPATTYANSYVATDILHSVTFTGCSVCPYPTGSDEGSDRLSNCTCPSCGDGRVFWQGKEQCDDGNLVVNDGCSPDCNIEELQLCQVWIFSERVHLFAHTSAKRAAMRRIFTKRIYIYTCT